MKKDDQTEAAPAATDELVLANSVSVAMVELADLVKEGLWPWPSESG